MALLSLLFRKPQRAQIGVMQLDASIEESHVRTATITNNPIEDGSKISDHVTLEPERLTINGLVSDVPLTFRSQILGAGIGVVTDIVGDALGGIGQQAAAVGIGTLAGLVAPKDDESGIATNDAFKYLEELYFNRTPFTVITRLKRYDNMLISNLNFPRSADIGGGLRFSIDMQKVTIVQSSTVKIPAFQIQAGSANRGQGTAKVGKQASTEVQEGTSTFDKSKSILANAADGNIKIDSARSLVGL